MKLILRICLFILYTASFEALLAQKVSVAPNQEKLIIDVDSQPEFPGGMDSLNKYITDHITITKRSNLKLSSGIVITQFLIDENGYLLNPKILRGLNPYFDSLSINAIKSMPRWVPAMRKGKSIGYLFNLPIKFEID